MAFDAWSKARLEAETAARKTLPERGHNPLITYYGDGQLPLPESAILPGSFEDQTLEYAPDEKIANLAVVIVAFNSWLRTRRCIDSLLAGLGSVEVRPRIILVDNGGTDRTDVKARDRFGERVTVVRMGRNKGLSAGLNAGFREAGEAHVLVLNNDIEAPTGWAARVIQSMDRHPYAGIIGYRLIGPNGKYHHLGSVFRQDGWGETNLWGREVPENGVYSGSWRAPLVMFSAVLIPARARAVVGEMDENFFLHLEDTDYCLRLRESGFPVVFDGSVEFVHEHQAATRDNGMELGKYQVESHEYLMHKWGAKLAQGLGDGPVVIRSRYHGAGGYPKHVREMARALDFAGIPTFLNEILDDSSGVWDYDPFECNLFEITRHLKAMEAADPRVGEMVLHIATPELWAKVPGAINVGWTMLEVDHLPSLWVRRCNQMDAVIVPCTWMGKMFVRNGVNVPVYVVPDPINTHIFNPRTRPFARANDRLQILSVFEWGERKAPEILLRSLRRLWEMRQDFDVILRTKGAACFDWINPILETSRSGVPIHVLEQGLPEWWMPSLYRSADVFALPSRGEGMGLPYLEAMASGLRVVGSSNTAMLDYLDEATGYPVPCSQAPADALCSLYEGSTWREPDEDAFLAQLNKALDDAKSDSDDWPTHREAIHRMVEARFSLESVAYQFRGVAAQIFADAGCRVPAWAVRTDRDGLPEQRRHFPTGSPVYRGVDHRPGAGVRRLVGGRAPEEAGSDPGLRLRRGEAAGNQAAREVRQAGEGPRIAPGEDPGDGRRRGSVRQEADPGDRESGEGGLEELASEGDHGGGA